MSRQNLLYVIFVFLIISFFIVVLAGKQSKNNVVTEFNQIEEMPDTTITTEKTTVESSITIHIKDFSFGSSSMTIPVDTTVIWVNDNSAAHDITAGSGEFVSPKIASGEKFEYKFTKKGVYNYHCSLHPNMKSAITVN